MSVRGQLCFFPTLWIKRQKEEEEEEGGGGSPAQNECDHCGRRGEHQEAGMEGPGGRRGRRRRAGRLGERNLASVMETASGAGTHSHINTHTRRGQTPAAIIQTAF